MRKIHWLMLLIILLFPIISLLFYPYMPEQVGTHWGFGPNPDNYEDKFEGTFVTAFLFMIISGFLVSIDIFASRGARKRFKNSKFAAWMDWFTFMMLLYLLLVYTLMLVWNVGYKFHLPVFLFSSLVVLLLMQLLLAVHIFTRPQPIEESLEVVLYDFSPQGRYRDNLVEIDQDKKFSKITIFCL